MTLPLAALGALIAALVETSVLPELQIAGTQADLVFVFAIVAAMLMGTEDGLVWAFLGGLMVDLVVPARPLGATTLTLLLATGAAILATRVLGRTRARAVIAVFLLTWPFHAVLIGLLVATEGVTLRTFEPRSVLVAAILNTLIAVPVAILFSAVERRFGETDRAEW